MIGLCGQDAGEDRDIIFHPFEILNNPQIKEAP
jgi:hypothetical protein